MKTETMKPLPSTLAFTQRLIPKILDADKVSRNWLRDNGVNCMETLRITLKELQWELELTCSSGEWRLKSLTTNN